SRAAAAALVEVDHAKRALELRPDRALEAVRVVPGPPVQVHGGRRVQAPDDAVIDARAVGHLEHLTSLPGALRAAALLARLRLRLAGARFGDGRVRGRLGGRLVLGLTAAGKREDGEQNRGNAHSAPKLLRCAVLGNRED